MCKRDKMKLFSQRKGIKPAKSKIQSDSMDNELRTGLWNVCKIYYWDKLSPTRPAPYSRYSCLSTHEDLHLLCRRLWIRYFKRPLDTLDDVWFNTYNKIKKYFFECAWNEVYDFIEFVAKNYPDESVNQKFIDYCNIVLERELSAYSFVNGIITQITSKEEISAIEEALKVPISPVREHLNSALRLLSDRKNPDYRNSIKESISAVESLCNLIAGKEKATLGQALKEIESKIALHPALKKAFSHLYGYTSDADGIRHSLMDETSVAFEDAKYMLVSCSSFINYLLAKAEKEGINL